MGWICSNSLYIGIKFHKESIKIINLFKYSISFSTVVLVSCCKLEVTWSCGQAVAASWKLKYTVTTEYYQNYYRELISESFKLMPHVYATFLIKELLQLIFGLKGLLCSCILNLYLVWHTVKLDADLGRKDMEFFSWLCSASWVSGAHHTGPQRFQILSASSIPLCAFCLGFYIWALCFLPQSLCLLPHFPSWWWWTLIPLEP